MQSHLEASNSHQLSKQRLLSDGKVIGLGIIGGAKLFTMLITIGLLGASGGLKIIDDESSGYVFTAATALLLFGFIEFIFTQFADGAGKTEYLKRIKTQRGLSLIAQGFKYPGPALTVAAKTIFQGTRDTGSTVIHRGRRTNTEENQTTRGNNANATENSYLLGEDKGNSFR